MTDPDTEVGVEGNEAWVCARVIGDLDRDVLRSISDEVIAHMSEYDMFRVLVDLSQVKGTPPPSLVQRLPEYYAARHVTRMAMALVLPPRGDRLDLSRFFKLAAQRHAYKVAIFDSSSSARAWLKAQDR